MITLAPQCSAFSRPSGSMARSRQGGVDEQTTQAGPLQKGSKNYEDQNVGGKNITDHPDHPLGGHEIIFNNPPQGEAIVFKKAGKVRTEIGIKEE